MDKRNIARKIICKCCKRETNIKNFSNSRYCKNCRYFIIHLKRTLRWNYERRYRELKEKYKYISSIKESVKRKTR